MQPASTREAVVDVDRFRALCAAAFTRLGVPGDEAGLAAQVLVRTDLRGVHTHGTQALGKYLRNLADGGAKPGVDIAVPRSSPTSAVVDGQAGLGLVVAVRATDLAIEKARASGVGLVAVRNSNHFGAAGFYALRIAEAGLIGLSTSNASPVMTATGSKGKALSNAPISYGVPTGGDFPMVLDVAMSATAGMKVRMAADRGETVPPGLIVGPDGLPTTDPDAYINGGSLVPMGDHKGYGLALLTETLAGALSGAAMTRGVAPWLTKTGTPTGTGHFFAAFDPEQFMDTAEFHARMQALITEMHELPRAPGVERIYVPGEIEHERETARLADGLPLEPVIWDHLVAVAKEHGLEQELEDALVAERA